MREPFLEPLLRQLRLRKIRPHVPRNSVILDIGCGTNATFLKAISPHVKQGFGVDFKVKEFKSSNIETKQLRLESHLPFPDRSFQVVTMLAVLEHIEQEKQILQEIYRVLIPGGKLVLTVPSVWSQPVLEFLAYKLKIVSPAEIRDHKRYYNRKKLQKVLVEITNFQEFRHQYFQLWMNNFCTVVKG